MSFTGIPNTSSWAGYDFLQWTGDTYHPGLDYNYGAGEADKGKPILCIGNGYVEKCLYWDGSTKGFGNHVFIKHTLEDGSVWYSHYCHLDSITCKEGQDIDMGSEIGKCGGSGGWPSHLHLEIRKATGKGYNFWPKPPEYTKEWIASNYADPFGFIEKRKYTGQDVGSDTIPVLKKDFENMRRKCDLYEWIIQTLKITDSETVVKETINKALTYEDTIAKLEREKRDIGSTAETLQKQLELVRLELEKEKKINQEHLATLTDQTQKDQIRIQSLTNTVEALQKSLSELKTQSQKPVKKPWYIKLLELLGMR